MANVLVFPDWQSFDDASEALESAQALFEVIPLPRFCHGLAVPVIRVPGSARSLREFLASRDISLSGLLPYHRFAREVPEAEPPDPLWKQVLGDLRVTAIKPSVTDPSRLRVEVVPEKSLNELIPVMARIIRGGSFRRDVPVLAFDEEHRLLAVSPREVVISRADDLLDAWIMLRSVVELIMSAWHHRSSLKPETEPRHGIGAIEIFKRLPGANCGRCRNYNCMEFAVGLLMGRHRLDECVSLQETQEPSCRQSLEWLLRAVGLTGAISSSLPREAPSPEPERGTPLHDRRPHPGEGAPVRYR
ncbi:MAG: hypothetical protein HY914_13710 [Desulfomonile tiedjei]|nr:hypothetical protein [Desulfomonile tiedjei]